MADSTDGFIPFNRVYLTGNEREYVTQAVESRIVAGDGPFTQKCHAWLKRQTRSRDAFLTHSCTAALEMAALLLDLDEGDEVIMPSYTFVSTANAFVLRGAIPVFVDIRPDTLNIDESAIEAAITPRTRAVVPVHYAGVSCEMDAILSIAERHGLPVIEDAAQGLMATYRGRPLGTMGVLGAYSFHESKNVVAGEGGALLINDPAYFARAEIIREKGTDRTQFFRGEIDKYTWRDVGSSYLPGEVTAAFLLAQFEGADEITRVRRALWDRYHMSLADAEIEGRLRRPVIPEECEHNGHMYYVVVRDHETRGRALQHLRAKGVDAVFHYIPLHSSPAGQRFGRAAGELPVTTGTSDCILRLPLWAGLSENQVDRVVQCLLDAVTA